nr:MAG TPA: hypothetical protein [Caudoviricetes sp.]
MNNLCFSDIIRLLFYKKLLSIEGVVFYKNLNNSWISMGII